MEKRSALNLASAPGSGGAGGNAGFASASPAAGWGMGLRGPSPSAGMQGSVPRTTALH